MYLCKGKIRCMIIVKMIVILMIGLLSSYNSVNAIGEVEKEVPNVLVVSPSKPMRMDEQQRVLDMLISHFTDNIVFRASEQVKEKDLEKVTHLFYYGYEKEEIPQPFLQMLQKYKGTMVAIGDNVEQLGDRFSFLERLPVEAVINEIILPQKPDKPLSFIPQFILNMYLVDTEHSRSLLVGKMEDNEYPIFVHHDKSYYFASSNMKPPFSIAFAEVLHGVFERESQMTNPAYIRLEDIHPLVDPEKLMDIAKILKEKKIPYMIAVIPEYINPETGKQYHFSDSPRLLKVLKYMQKNGGSIILHGYSHQFRSSETGEGFEFWDVEYNMPIYHTREATVVMKTKEDFENQEAYEQYLSNQKAYERKYIETKLTRGIQELANYGLYPLAFEAPHYAMSQHGYQITSEYFSTYVGQLQVSDEDWEIMKTAPYIIKPSFLNGMIVLPETMGYVVPGDPQAIDKMLNHAHDYQFVRDGMVAGFFHPYLGKALFIELIERMEGLSNIAWIDLKQMNNRVHAENVEISTVDGELIVHLNRIGLFFTSVEYLTFHVKMLAEKVVWGVAAIGSFAVMIFIGSIFISRSRNKEEEWGKEID